MKDPPNYLPTGIDGSLELLTLLHDGNRVAISNLPEDSTEPTLAWTELDSTTTSRAAAASVLNDYRDSATFNSPMEGAFTWALDQFAVPTIAVDGRPHVIVVFTDGVWSVDSATVSALTAANVSLMFVLIPGSKQADVQHLMTATAAATPKSELFAATAITDIVESFRRVARAIQGKSGSHRSGSLGPGESADIAMRVDAGVSSASMRVAWGADGATPTITLVGPEGDVYTLSDVPYGVFVSQDAQSATFTFDPSEALHGTWTAHLEHPAQATASATLSSVSVNTAPPSADRLFLPFLRSGDGKPAQSSQTLATTQTTSAETIAYKVDIAAGSLLSAAFGTDHVPALHVTLADPTGPITDTTALWAEITASDGITGTALLFDDGQHDDGGANDGAYAGVVTPQLQPGLQHVALQVRHLSVARGYIEQTIERDLYRTYDDFEADDAYTQAQPIDLHIPQKRWLWADDADWFSFIPEPGVPHTIMANSSSVSDSIRLDLFASDGTTLLQSQTGAQVDMFSAPVENPGTYYLRARPTYSGEMLTDYQLQIAPYTCTADPDEPNNFASFAQPFTVGTNRPGTVCFTQDPDWVSIDATPGYTYNIATNGRNRSGSPHR